MRELSRDQIMAIYSRTYKDMHDGNSFAVTIDRLEAERANVEMMLHMIDMLQRITSIMEAEWNKKYHPEEP